MKKNFMLIAGIECIIISLILSIITFLTKQSVVFVITLVVAIEALIFILAGTIIQKIDELINKFTPSALYEAYKELEIKIELNKTTNKQQEKIVRMLKTSNLEDSSTIHNSTDRDPNLYWQPGQKNW